MEPLQAIISERTAGVFALMLSTAGLCSMLYFRKSESVTAALKCSSILVALALPLWWIYSAMDRWLDMTSLKGGVAALLLFLMFGTAAGLLTRRAEQHRYHEVSQDTT